jgi:hypothetical protein
MAVGDRKPQDGPEYMPVPLTLNGVSDISSFAGTAVGVCPPDNMLNAWPYEPATRHQRLGMRPRLASVFLNASGQPWRAPSYIQGFGQVNIAKDTRVQSGALAEAILQDEDGGGFGHPGTLPNRGITLIDNLHYQGGLTTPPPTIGGDDYTAYFGTGEAIAGAETASGLTSPAVRWDRFASLNDEITHEKDQILQVFNYHVTDAGLGKTIARARLVSMRKNISTDEFEYINEYEISDGGHTGAATNGKFSFAVSGDANSPWHISANDIDIGESYVYVAVLAYQTSNSNYDGTVSARRGWTIAIPREEFDPGMTHTYPPTRKVNLTPWAQECVSVRYREGFTSTTYQGVTYGTSPDILILFSGYRDFQSGIGRYSEDLSALLRIGEIPTWANPGHGALRTAYTGQSEAQLDTAGAAALIDGDHSTCRLSVVSEQQRGTLRADRNNTMNTRWTHGCQAIAMDVDHTTGEIFVARTAIGFGIPNPDGIGGYATTYTLENRPEDTVPQISVMSLTPYGTLNWEVDTRTRQHTGGWTSGIYGPFYNDRLRPTLNWITADQHGGAMVVGRWAQNRNVWHTKQSVTGSTIGTVDWSKGIGSPNGTVKDSTGATTTIDDFGETIGLGELTLYSCDVHKGDGQYEITGHPFVPSTLVDGATFAGGNPTAGRWYVKALNAASAGIVQAYAGGTTWKLSSTGAAIWKRYLGSSTISGTAVDLKTPLDETSSGAFAALVHERITGTNAASGSGWQWNSSSHWWWLRNEAPVVRHTVIFDRELGGSEEVVYHFRKRVHSLMALVKTNDGSEGWEIGTFDDLGTWRLVIRKVTDGIPALSFLDSAALSDLGLTDDDAAFDLRVRIRNNTIEAFLSTQTDQDTAAVSGLIDDYFEFTRMGFASRFQTTATGQENDGAYVDTTAQIVRVSAVDVYNLITHEISAAQVLCIFSSGRLYAVKDGTTVEQVAGLGLPDHGLIRSAQHHQKLYIVWSGGGYAKVYDPGAEPGDALADWDPSEGNLPGATDDGSGGYVAGTTTATNIAMHLDRIWLYGMPEDPQNAELSAIGDADKWDKDAAVDFGAATNLSNEVAGVVGVPITGLFPYSDDRIIMGSETQINAMYGDPEFESARVNNITRESGVRALTYADTGAAFCITEQGAALITGNEIAFISKDKLNKYIVPSTHSGTVLPLILRDANRYGVFFGFTRVNDTEYTTDDADYYRSTFLSDGTTELRSRHLWFSEQTGGWYPLDFQSRADPTAVFKYGEQILFGGKDGYIRTFDDSVDTDWGSEAFPEIPVTCYFPTSLITSPQLRNGLSMVEQFIILSVESQEPTLYYQVAETPEELYELAPNVGEADEVLDSTRNLLGVRLSAPAMQLSFYGTSPFYVEKVEVGIRYEKVWRSELTDVAPVTPANDNLASCPVEPPPSGTIEVSPDSASVPVFASLVNVTVVSGNGGLSVPVAETPGAPAFPVAFSATFSAITSLVSVDITDATNLIITPLPANASLFTSIESISSSGTA